MQVIAEQQRKRFAQAELAHRSLTLPKVLAEDKGHMLLQLDAAPATCNHPSPAVSAPHVLKAFPDIVMP